MTALQAPIPASLARLAQPNPAGVPKLALSGRELAAALGISVKTLERMRRDGADLPPCFSLGDATRRYPVNLVIEWMESKCRADGTSG